MCNPHISILKAFESPPNPAAVHDFSAPVAACEPRAASQPPRAVSPPPTPLAASFTPTRRPRQLHTPTASTQSPLSFRNLSPTRKQPERTPQPASSAPTSTSSRARPSSANAVTRSSSSPSALSPAQFFTKRSQIRAPLTFSKGICPFALHHD